MKIQIEIVAGPGHHEPTKYDMQKNINALERAIALAGAADTHFLIDTKSILEGIQRELPDG